MSLRGGCCKDCGGGGDAPNSLMVPRSWLLSQSSRGGAADGAGECLASPSGGAEAETRSGRSGAEMGAVQGP